MTKATAKRITTLWVDWRRGKYYVSAGYNHENIVPRQIDRAESYGGALRLLHDHARRLGLAVIEVTPKPNLRTFMAVIPTVKPPIIEAEGADR